MGVEVDPCLVFKICSLSLAFRGFLDNFKHNINYSLYTVKNCDQPVAIFSIHPFGKKSSVQKDKIELKFSSPRWNVWGKSSYKIFEINFSKFTKELALVIELDKRKLPYQGNIYYLKNINHDPLLFFGGNLLFSELLPEFKGLLLHGSCISNSKGEAIIFAGKSGSGKTTFANIASRDGFKKISDDLIGIRMRGKKLYAYPLPWVDTPGVEPQNKPYPVKELLILNRFKTNFLSSLSPSESFKLLYPCCYIPYWDRGALNKSLLVLFELAQTGICKKLNFIPDLDLSSKYLNSHLTQLEK